MWTRSEGYCWQFKIVAKIIILIEVGNEENKDECEGKEGTLNLLWILVFLDARRLMFKLHTHPAVLQNRGLALGFTWILGAQGTDVSSSSVWGPGFSLSWLDTFCLTGHLQRQFCSQQIPTKFKNISLFLMNFLKFGPFAKSLLHLLQHCFCSTLFFFFGWQACGILALWSGTEPSLPALKGEVVTSGPPGRFLEASL